LTIIHFVYRIAREYKGTIAGIASMMGRNEKVLASKLNPNVDTHHLNIDELELLAEFTDTSIDVAQYFASKANAVVVRLPDMPDGSDLCLLDAYMQIMKELGELSAEFQKAFADGVINRKEFSRICVEVTGVQAKLLAFQQIIEAKVV